jgi:hypothetical protein
VLWSTTQKEQTIKYLIAVLLSALIFSHANAQTPVNNSEPKVATTTKPVSKTPTKDITLAKAVEQIQTPAPQTPAAQPETIPTPITPTTHDDLMKAAGIQPEDYGAVDYIISHESSWNANATEPTTGAHGLPQALPYSKTNCGWDDAVCQLTWANTYAISRYGGWWPAQAYWAAHRNW